MFQKLVALAEAYQARAEAVEDAPAAIPSKAA
jgi:hypothetical protein